MKIKYRITVLFTLLVTAILLFLCVSIYYFAGLNRQKEFRTRLKNRALTTVSLLMKVPGINKSLLKKIDESTLVALQKKSVIVYDLSGNLVYDYIDENTVPVTINANIIDRVKKSGEYYFEQNEKDVAALEYNDGSKDYIVIAAAYDQDGFSKDNELKWILVFSFVTGGLITFVTGLFFSIRLVAPIKKITNEVKEISSQNLSRRINIAEPKDELNELSSTFNDLMNRLQESFEIQRRFIANASHELSTPLTSVLSQLEITLQNERSVNEYKEVMDSVYDDVKNLTQLTKSLLEIAKASGTSAGIELLLIRIDELLMKLPSELKKIDTKYNVELSFDSFPDDEDKLLIFGNSDLIYNAVKNIVLNACKYSETHVAHLALHFSENTLEINIDDDGPGIKEEDMPYIFQPFYRGSNINYNPGFGLGLSLASRIIGMHKGTLKFKNKPEGGTVFNILLPIAKDFHAI